MSTGALQPPAGSRVHDMYVYRGADQSRHAEQLCGVPSGAQLHGTPPGSPSGPVVVGIFGELV